MKKVLGIIVGFLMLFTSITPVLAIESPFAVPNNKFGIHILFPSELSQAAALVNSNGGDWGYVTIPIQAGDKDLVKWQSFMDDCRKYHLIPLIRLSTEDYYFNTTVWRKPTYADVLDFANFLNSLNWPVKNRYVIVFNEVNRGDEWGGTPNPAEYAIILSYAVTAFKTASPDFFVISAGMDNAAANTGNAMNEYDFYAQMNESVPGIFNQIDGFSSHSYPNPAFSQPPWVKTGESIDSFAYEKSLIGEYSSKNLPVFITETGWSQDNISSSTIGSYFTQAFSSVWSNPSIVAVTPFLLDAGAGPFQQFSLFSPTGSPNAIYQAITSIQKVKGAPLLNPTPVVLAASTNIHLQSREFTRGNLSLIPHISAVAKDVLKWFLHLP